MFKQGIFHLPSPGGKFRIVLNIQFGYLYVLFSDAKINTIILQAQKILREYPYPPHEKKISSYGPVCDDVFQPLQSIYP